MTGVSKRWLYLLPIVALALAVRTYDLARNGLWYDELQSVTHAVLPISDLIRSVAAHDPHPPLYYIQLHAWLQLGHSDVWVRLNSVFLSLLTLISIYITTRRVFSEPAAVLASLFFAISPYAVYHGQEARMYTWLMFLAVWCWYFNHEFLLRRPGPLPALGVVATSIAALYSHGTGFILLSAIYAYAALSLVRSKIDRLTLLRWTVLQAAIVLALLPWLFHAYTIRSFPGHMAVPTLVTIPETLWMLLFGDTTAPAEWIQVTCVLLVFAVIVLGFARGERSRSFAPSVVLGPMLAVAAISYLISPIWYHRTLAFITPFLCIALALGLTPTDPDGRPYPAPLRRLAPLLGAAVLGGYLVALLVQQTTYTREPVPKTAALYVKAQMTPGEIVYVPKQRFFWAVSWYLGGPNCASPVDPSRAICLVDGVKVMTHPDIGRFLTPGQYYWFVHRPNEGFTHSAEFRRLELRNFGMTRVEHVRLVP
ncbi:MAG: hypothetical protein AMS25_02300 [Gemmatimonas sp. SM23_52]|nr:MAG: hypothetical protein AMS25_02300 [Gemmatimonas sp. SM23_52]